MRIIDETLGPPLCSLLSFFAFFGRLIPFKKKALDPLKVKKILCQKHVGMGSILNAIPLIKALRAKYPNAKVTFLTVEANKGVVELCEIADEIITIRLDSAPKFMADTLKTIVYFCFHRFDISIDLEFFSKFTLILSFFTFAPIRVGLHQRRIRPDGLLTHKVFYNPYKHISQIYFAFASSLGIPYQQEYFASLLPSMKNRGLASLRQKLNLNEEKKIMTINVNVSNLFEFRRWPADRFQQLIELLTRHYPDYQYVMIGGKEDRAYVDSIFQKINGNGPIINAAGETTLIELFALIEASALMITNDSGPFHIASLYHVNTVAFFGPETPIVYGPIHKNALVFYLEDLYCSPCMSVFNSKQCLYGETCPDNICLQLIEPQDVFKKIEKVFLMDSTYVS